MSFIETFKELLALNYKKGAVHGKVFSCFSFCATVIYWDYSVLKIIAEFVLVSMAKL